MPELRFAGSDGSRTVVVVNEPEPAPALFVSPAGADTSTFDRAYRQAAPGQVIEVAPGVYPEQTVRARTGMDGLPVVFRPPPGQRAQVGKGGTDDDLEVYASHVEFRDLDVFDNWYARNGVRGLVFRNVNARKWYARSVDGLQIIGGVTTDPQATGVPTVSATDSGFPPSRNVLIEDHLIERIWRPQGDTSSHREGLHIMGVDGLMMRRCTIREVLGNTAALSFNIHHSSVIRRVLLEDCLIEGTYGGGAFPQPTGQGPSVNISNRTPGYEITFRRLRSRDGSPVVPQGQPEYPGAIRFEECVFKSPPNMGLAAGSYSWDYRLEA